MISQATTIRIKDHFEQFIAKKIVSISEMSLEDMDLNPFLIAIMRDQFAMKTPHDLAEWLVRQRVERSMVTSFGITLQTIAKEFCNEKPRSGLTGRIVKDGVIYNLIIKSGPKHNTHVTSGIHELLLRSKRNEPDSTPIFGICYGDEYSVGTIVRKYAKDVDLLTGRDFWAFITGDPKGYEQILQIAEKVGKNYRDREGKSLNIALARKVKYVQSELEKMYGDDHGNFWKKFVGDVY